MGGVAVARERVKKSIGHGRHARKFALLADCLTFHAESLQLTATGPLWAKGAGREGLSRWLRVIKRG